jgi:hypothetical protein
MVWLVKTHPAHSTGLESKKNSSDGEGFSLDRSFYRTDISNPAPRNFRFASDSAP